MRIDPFLHFLGEFCRFLTELKLKDRKGLDKNWDEKKVLPRIEIFSTGCRGYILSKSKRLTSHISSASGVFSPLAHTRALLLIHIKKTLDTSLIYIKDISLYYCLTVLYYVDYAVTAWLAALPTESTLPPFRRWLFDDQFKPDRWME